MPTGQCHCGAIRYEVTGTPFYTGLCHCSDCRRHAGAPMVGWTAYPEDGLKVLQGAPKVYVSSAHGRRHFCPDCGTGLLYYNAEILPGIVDIQVGTLDHPEDAAPQMHVQVAERIGWMATAQDLPAFERYPPME